MAKSSRTVLAIVATGEDVPPPERFRSLDTDFEPRAFGPVLDLPRALHDAGVRVALLDATAPGPAAGRLLRKITESRETAAVPVIVIDPDGEFRFDTMPFASVPSPEDPDLPRLIRAAAKAAERFAAAGAVLPADLPVTPATRARFFEFLRRATGLLLEKGSANSALQALQRRMFARKTLSPWEYLSELQFRDEDQSEFRRLVPSFTVAETAFFRTPSHFSALKRIVIPDILARKRKSSSRIRVWSAGCATATSSAWAASSSSRNASGRSSASSP
ncbi:MAG: hypothetical protein MUC63_04530 [Planctomycetes bacterium]|jgi:hypothetical protein|nr:hypothetical protein [Planctomycetota bacterium]